MPLIEAINSPTENFSKTKEQKPAQTEAPWYHLSGTGFNVEPQIQTFIKGYKDRLQNGSNPSEAFNDEFMKIAMDIRAFEHEYLKRLAGLKWEIDFGIVNGEKRIIATGGYQGKLLEEVTAKSERNGSVYEAWYTGDQKRGIPGIEKWLITAPKNSIAVLVSPEGWSGFNTQDNEPILYPESQIYVAQIDENKKLQAYTFRWEAGIHKNEKLQKELGLNVPEVSNQKERIIQTVKNVAFFRGDDPNTSIKTPQDVVRKMEKANGNNPVAFEGKTFNEIQTFLKNTDSYLTYHSRTPYLISELKKSFQLELNSQNNSEEEKNINLQINLALTILKLNDEYEKQKNKTIYQANSIQNINPNDNDLIKPDPRSLNNKNTIIGNAIQNLSQKGGCAGGGNSTKVNSMGSSRSGEINLSGIDSPGEKYKFDRKGKCRLCEEDSKWIGPCNICTDCDPEGAKNAARSSD